MTVVNDRTGRVIVKNLVADRENGALTLAIPQIPALFPPPAQGLTGKELV